MQALETEMIQDFLYPVTDLYEYSKWVQLQAKCQRRDIIRKEKHRPYALINDGNEESRVACKIGRKKKTLQDWLRCNAQKQMKKDRIII